MATTESGERRLGRFQVCTTIVEMADPGVLGPVMAECIVLSERRSDDGRYVEYTALNEAFDPIGDDEEPPLYSCELIATPPIGFTAPRVISSIEWRRI